MSTTPGSPDDDARTKQEIEADLEATRDHLAGTVDALSRKLDVKSRSREKVRQVKRDHGRDLAVGGVVVALSVVAIVVWRRRRR